MTTTAFPESATPAHLQSYIQNRGVSEMDWMRMAIGGGLLTGAVLLLSGKRRAGLVVSAAATALTLLEEQEAVKSWWKSLPKYLDDAERLLDQAQHTIEDLSQKRERLRAMFNR